VKKVPDPPFETTANIDSVVDPEIVTLKETVVAFRISKYAETLA